MKIRRSVLKDVVTLRTRTAEGSYGDVLAEAVLVPCLIDETRRLVRDASGQETVSEATLTLHPHTTVVAEDNSATTVDPLDVFTAESEVLIGVRVSRVITAKALRLRGYTTAVEVTCA